MQDNRPPPSHSQSGNALFLILIAVALFAALSYAITTSSRGGGSIEKETAVLLAAQITQQGAALRSTVTRMILTGTPSDLVGGTPLTFFAYEPHPYNEPAWNFIYGSVDTDPSNELFNPAGGGALFPIPPGAACVGGECNDILVGGWIFLPLPVDGIGTADPDVLMETGYLTEPVCTAINRGLGLSNPPAVEADPGAGFNAYPGAAAACVNAPGGYIYYHVLLER